MMTTRVLVVIGPTSVGKTKMGVELAKKLNGEIISGDSMQIYKEMDIGSAKPTKEEKQGGRTARLTSLKKKQQRKKLTKTHKK